MHLSLLKLFKAMEGLRLTKKDTEETYVKKFHKHANFFTILPFPQKQYIHDIQFTT